MATRRSLRDMQSTVDSAPTVWLGASANFSGGMDSATDPRDIDPLQCQLVYNGYVSLANRAVRRPGFTSLLGSDFASPIRAMRRFSDANSTFTALIVWAGANVWEVLDDGTAVLLMSRDSAYASEPPVGHCEFGEKVYFSYAWAGILSLEVTLNASYAVVYSGGIGAAIAGTDGGFRGTAVASGNDGNALVLEMVNDGPSTSLTVGYADGVITVHLATDGSSVITSDATAIVAALNGDAGVAAVASFEVLNGSTLGTVISEQFFGGAAAGHLKAWPVNYDYDFRYLATREGSDRIFGIDAGDPASLRWCDALTPGTWNSASVWRPGGRFTGIIEIQGVLVALQEGRILRIDGTDPTTWEGSRAMAEGLGLPEGASGSLRELEGVALYVSQTGLTIYDGSRPRVLSNTVKTREQACRNYVPLNADEWEGAFTDVWRDYIMVFYRSGAGLTGCDRVLLYDFRRSIFAGVWDLAEPVTCSSCEEAEDGVAASLILGTVSGNLLRENDVFTDDGATYEFLLRTKVYDFGRETLDKQIIEMRSRYYAGSPTTLNMSLYRESDHTTPVTTIALAIAAEGEGTLIKRVPHYRGTDFFVEFSQTDDVYLEVAGSELDAFFAARR